MNDVSRFGTIDHETLEQVAGGVNWSASFDKAMEWGCRGGTLGTVGGAAVGSVIPGVGTMTGAGVAGLGGTLVGFAGGLGKGIYDTWNQ